MTFLLLGAGKGTRLLPYTADRPKWLLPVGAQPVLHSLVGLAHRAGLVRVGLVRSAGGPEPGLPGIQVFENARDTNMVGSLFEAEDAFGDDLIVSYADILYEPRVLEAVLESTAAVSVVVDRDWFTYYSFRSNRPLADAETLKLNGRRILEIGAPLENGSRPPEAQYIGLMRFRDNGLRELVAAYHELRASRSGQPWRHAGRFEQAFMTDMIQELVDRGVDVEAIPIQRGWLEFDTRDDYERVLAAVADGSISKYIDLAKLPNRPTVLSAGGVLWRLREHSFEIAVVAQGESGEWRIPKGMLEPGERPQEAASREVAEETGWLCASREFLGTSTWNYDYGGREWEEICRFYLLDLSGERRGRSDPQIRDVKWMSVPAALAALRYRDERKIVRVAEAVIARRRSDPRPE